jgi:AcrR family transcriptional regulator
VTDTRDRFITATSELFRRKGYRGTSLKEVTDAAGAPIGSLYHFFPGGKDDLAEATIRTSGRAYQELFEVIADGAVDMAVAVTDFFDAAAAVLAETDYIDACPIGTVALEVASTDERLRSATDDVFRGWIEAAASRLTEAGLAVEDAEELATALVAAVEGGFMLSRARRSPEPMRATGRHVRRLVELALAEVGVR